MIRINKNESPYRALTKEEISKIAIDTHYNFYAEDEYDQLRAAYAAFNGLDPDLVSFANGSDEWIQKSMIVLGKGPVLALEPDFVMYDVYAEQLDRKLLKIACKDDFSFDYEEVYQKIREEKPSIFIFSQPNNPFGMLHPADFIWKAADLMKEVGGYFVLDEAYGEFVENPSNYPEGDHVIRLRTLSKVYGLAGLRIGVAASTHKTMEKLNSIAHPYPLNTFSLNVATYLIKQADRLNEFIELNRTLSIKLNQIFRDEVGDIVPILPSHTNFLFTYGDTALELGEWVIEHGFLPRTYPEATESSLQKAVRYSIGTDEQLDQLQLIIRKWREEKWQSLKNA